MVIFNSYVKLLEGNGWEYWFVLMKIWKGTWMGNWFRGISPTLVGREYALNGYLSNKGIQWEYSWDINGNIDGIHIDVRVYLWVHLMWNTCDKPPIFWDLNPITTVIHALTIGLPMLPSMGQHFIWNRWWFNIVWIDEYMDRSMYILENMYIWIVHIYLDGWTYHTHKHCIVGNPLWHWVYHIDWK